VIIGDIDVHFTMSDAFPGKVMRSAAGLQRGLT
jgi:hypothetical protein